ncbi:unnamed protein product [Diamesa tonsa]
MGFNSVLFVVFVSIAVVQVFGQYEDGIPIRTFAVQTPAQLCNNGNRYQTLCNMADPCASNGVVFCTGPGVGLAIACPDNQPNCVTNANGGLCSAMKDEQCPVPASDYVCTSVGRFPDPKNCRLFYNCEWNDDYSEIVAVPMRCRTNYVFDELAINGDCRLQRGSNDCTRVNCINSAPASYVPYGRSQQLYALCLSNNTIMFSCPDNNQVDLKVSPPKCSYRCIFLGKFPYSRDVFKYYDCFISAVTYRVESELKTCPRRQEFNPQSRLCEKSNRPSTTLPVTTLPSTTLTESGTSTASNTTLIIPL